MKENIILGKSIDFSIRMVRYCDVLYSKKEFIIANQLLRSATSIGSNIFEAQDAESRLDVIHKMKIASKVASETFYWLTLCDKLDNFELPPECFNELKQISALLGRIITTSRKNLE